MSNEVLKVDDERFCVWSNTVDSPLMWGTREECHEYLVELIDEELARERKMRLDLIPGRLDRAASVGTSSFLAGDGPRSWIYEQKGVLHQHKLGRFLDSYDGEDDSFDLSILEPFDD